MKELDVKENSSKSLLANVLDMDDDFRPASTMPHNYVYPQMGNTAKNITGGVFRWTFTFYFYDCKLQNSLPRMWTLNLQLQV